MPILSHSNLVVEYKVGSGSSDGALSHVVVGDNFSWRSHFLDGCLVVQGFLVVQVS